MRAVKIVGTAVLGLLLLVALVVGALVTAGDPVIARFIERHGSGLLGREVRIGGAFHIGWGRPIRVIAEDVHIANADWGSAPEMLAMQRLELEIEPWPLLRFKYVVPRLALTGPKLLLEKSPDGQGNWNFFAAKAATPQKRTQFPDLHRFEVSGGTFTWSNQATNATTELSFTMLQLGTPDTTSPIAIAAKGDFQHKPYALTARVGPLEQLQRSGDPYPVTLQATVERDKIGLDGTIAEPMEAEGIDLKATVEGGNLQEFLALFTVPLPATPVYRLAGHVTHSGDKWSVDDLDGRLGASRVKGGIGIDVGGKVPYLEANLTSTYLDLADFKGFYGGKPEHPATRKAKAAASDQAKAAEKKPPSDARVIPDTALPIEKLPGLDVDLTLDAAQVKPTGGLPFERVTLVLAIKDGNLALKPLRFGIAAGEVAMNLAFAAKARPPELDADIDFRHVDIKKLFDGMDVSTEVKQLAGILGGYLKLKSKGRSEREILARADGKIGFFMAGGQFSHLILELMHLDVLESLGWWVQGDAPLPVNCLVTQLDVAEGIATASTFLFDTTDALIQGAGNVNVADETIAMDLVPRHKKPVALTFRTPIHIRGTFGKPDVSLDPATLGARIAASVGLGVLAPPAALLPLIKTGLGDVSACSTAFAAAEEKQRLEDNANASGSSPPATKAKPAKEKAGAKPRPSR
jgi:uncharacterized protein involved in outer membrane biogenesis